MNNKDYIHRLTEKFMEGDTTLREEQELYRYFSGSDVAEDLLTLRPLFTGLAALPDIYSEEPAKIKGAMSAKTTERHKGRHARFVQLMLRRASVAAAVLLLFLGGTAVYRSQNYSEVIVYGHKSSDAVLLHHEIATTMQQLDMQPENSVKAQLDDVLLGQEEVR
jgi:hypothetical protein